MIFASLSQKASQPSAARAAQGYNFPTPLESSQWVLFYLFHPVGASQAREFQVATTTTPRKTVQTTFCTVICIFFHKILQTPCFLKCVCMFLQCFPSKHGNLHMCHHKSVPKHNFLQCFQFPWLPKPLKTPLFTLSSSISPCWPPQTYIQKILQKHCCLQCFNNVFRRTVIYTFFGIKSVQNTGFCSVFNALASKNLSKYRYLQCFSFLSVFPLPETYQNDPKFHFYTLLSSDTQKHHLILVSVRNRFCTPPS